MLEIWRDIKDYEGLYQVSNLGRVRSLDHYVNGYNGLKLKKGKILKGVLNQYGYLYVSLHVNGLLKHFRIHRLVAMAFPDLVDWTEGAKGKPFDEIVVNHKNEIKTDNRVDNLEWCTNEDNHFYGTCIDRIRESNINNPKTSKSVVQYTLDGQFVAEYPSISEASRQTGILSSYICKNLKGYDKFESAGGYIWKYSLQPVCG